VKGLPIENIVCCELSWLKDVDGIDCD